MPGTGRVVFVATLLLIAARSTSCMDRRPGRATFHRLPRYILSDLTRWAGC